MLLLKELNEKYYQYKIVTFVQWDVLEMMVPGPVFVSTVSNRKPFVQPWIRETKYYVVCIIIGFVYCFTFPLDYN